MKIEFSEHILEKYSHIKFHEKSVQWEQFCSMRTKKGMDWEPDRQTDMTKVIVAFCSYDNAPTSLYSCKQLHNPYPTAFPYGNGMVLHFYQQQESSTTKTVHKVINKGLKTYV